MIVFANFLSYLFHPVLLFMLVPFLVVYRQTGSILYGLKWEIFSSVFIFLGVILTLLAKHKGLFSDSDLSQKEERWKFYFMGLSLGILYFAASSFFKGILFPLTIITLGIIAGLLVFTLVNRYLKASMHVAVACAFIITLGLLYGIAPFLVTLGIIPLLSWSRITLKKHTLGEVITGGFLGGLITMATFLIGKYLYSI